MAVFQLSPSSSTSFSSLRLVPSSPLLVSSSSVFFFFSNRNYELHSAFIHIGRSCAHVLDHRPATGDKLLMLWMHDRYWQHCSMHIHDHQLAQTLSVFCLRSSDANATLILSNMSLCVLCAGFLKIKYFIILLFTDFSVYFFFFASFSVLYYSSTRPTNDCVSEALIDRIVDALKWRFLLPRLQSLLTR